MAQRLQLIAPRQLVLETLERPMPSAQEVSIAISCSALSQGSELLAFRGELENLDLGTAIDPLQSSSYPRTLGYAAVGRITATGSSNFQMGQRVFCLTSHATHACVAEDMVFPIPDDVSDERALFFANGETAVTLCLDAQALLGERCAVWGLGIVGGLCSALLSRYPLEELLLFEPSARRRELIQETLGLRPQSPPSTLHGLELDLSIEVSGSETALQAAMEHACYGGRIIVGSWFGNKQVALPLGGNFHRRRLQLISSQVSTIAPHLRGRFDRQRRASLVWNLLRSHPFERWITHRWKLDQAAAAYTLLDQSGASTMQSIFTYN